MSFKYLSKKIQEAVDNLVDCGRDTHEGGIVDKV